MKFLLVLLCSIAALNSNAQEKPTLYHPEANAAADIAAAIANAKQEGKYVLIQAGGNWCTWCIEFAKVASTVPILDSTMKASFVWYHLNYSTENTNDAIFEKLGFPQRFGFPSFIILDGDGNRLHTQNSEYLEDGKKSYNINKVEAFLSMWSPRALNPTMYGR